MNTNLEKLLLRQEQLTAQIRDLQARERVKKRKADTRARILLGAALVSQAKNESVNHLRQIDQLARYIKNKKDRDFLTSWISSNFSQE